MKHTISDHKVDVNIEAEVGAPNWPLPGLKELLLDIIPTAPSEAVPAEANIIHKSGWHNPETPASPQENVALECVLLNVEVHYKDKKDLSTFKCFRRPWLCELVNVRDGGLLAHELCIYPPNWTALRLAKYCLRKGRLRPKMLSSTFLDKCEAIKNVE